VVDLGNSVPDLADQKFKFYTSCILGKDVNNLTIKAVNLTQKLEIFVDSVSLLFSKALHSKQYYNKKAWVRIPLAAIFADISRS